LILKQIIGYDIYHRFTMEHFSLCQSMILTTNFFLLATVSMYRKFAQLPTSTSFRFSVFGLGTSTLNDIIYKMPKIPVLTI
jgi:hypothetical protein